MFSVRFCIDYNSHTRMRVYVCMIYVRITVHLIVNVNSLEFLMRTIWVRLNFNGKRSSIDRSLARSFQISIADGIALSKRNKSIYVFEYMFNLYFIIFFIACEFHFMLNDISWYPSAIGIALIQTKAIPENDVAAHEYEYERRLSCMWLTFKRTFFPSSHLSGLYLDPHAF